MRLIYFLLIIFFAGIHAEQHENLVINNRILAKVHGKTISVIDVMKRMNVIIIRHLPDIEATERYQFYTAQWREILAQMIDEQLILADAEKIELKINDGDVREKLQERFGPNVIANIEKLGLSYEEAKEMIRTEIIVQRMTWYRINAKAILSINPKDVKVAYKEYCLSNPPKDEWRYQALAIRSSDEKVNEEIAQEAALLLQQGKAGLVAVAEELQQREGLPKDLSITVSQEYIVDQKNLSDSHKNVLVTIEPGGYSPPLAQPSRTSNQIIHRIFHLKERIQEQKPPFGTLAERLEDKLIESAIKEATSTYIYKLRDRFGYDEKMMEVIPNDFQPFVLG